GAPLTSLTTPSVNTELDSDSYFGSHSQVHTPSESNFPGSPLAMTPVASFKSDSNAGYHPYTSKKSKKDPAKYFKLRDHEEPTLARKSNGSGNQVNALTLDVANLEISEAPVTEDDSETDAASDSMENLGLTLGDPSNLEEAKKM